MPPKIRTPLLPVFVDYAERFWRMVDRREDDVCWPFRGKLGGGFGWEAGRFAFRDHSGRLITAAAPRVAYALCYGVDPGILLVCHRCDHPRCCNPAHLFAGTEADNAQDAVAKGRLGRGNLTPAYLMRRRCKRLPPPAIAPTLPSATLTYWKKRRAA